MSRAKKVAEPVAPTEDGNFGRLIDVQVWKIMDKFGKVKKNSSNAAGGNNAVSTSTSVSGEGENGSKLPSKPSKTMKIARSQISKLIGPKGATVKKFEEHFGVSISQTSESKDGEGERGPLIVAVTGDTADAVQSAVAAIKQFMTTGVAPWSEEQLITITYDVPPRSAKEILGDQGRTKAVIGKHTRTQIMVPNVPERDLDSPTPVSVKISGRTTEDVEKAKEIMEDIVLFHCSTVTHPQSTYLQMDVPAKYHGRILGQRGATIRQLETDHGVRVYLPTSVQPNVVVVGDNADKVSRAMDAIEDIMDDFDKKEAARLEAEATRAAAKEAAKAAKAAAKAAAAAAAADAALAATEHGADEEKKEGR